MKLHAIALSAAFICTAGVNAAHHTDNVSPHSYPIASNSSKMNVVKQTFNDDKPTSRKAMFTFEPQLGDGDFLYTVEFESSALAGDPSIQGYLQNRSIMRKPAYSIEKQTIATAAKRLKNEQRQILQRIESQIGKQSVITDYQYALNGVVLKLSQKQAAQLTRIDGIKRITRDVIHHLDTDRGPELVGAPLIWDGQLPGITGTQGEGVVVGILDSGINTDHPSFAATSGDGYTHINPLGSGVFVGDCVNGFPELCNDKLIGVRSYSVITSNYDDTDVFPPNLPKNGEDYDGHGSHVASTAAGNVLLNVTERIPEVGEEESDGLPGEFTYDRISGVAPRANIISYQVCNPGSEGDSYSGCPTSAINSGIEDAIRDGVDVINMSISGGGNPWRSSTEQAFLNAQNAGIFVAVSAGNSGPNPATSEKNAPWYTAVAAAEHGRVNAYLKFVNNFSGGTYSPGTISGQSNTGSITAPVVFAGDFDNPNDPNNPSKNCLEPFPAGTFDGEIVLCDRGEIARVQKAQNVADGGAGGFILANIDGGATFLANDQYVVPGIQVKAAEGNALKAWLNSGTGHRATITAANATQSIDEDRVDVLAGFSSRGPNATNSTLTPAMTAPGVDIFAAYADQHFGRDETTPAPSDFDYLQGTSMSSPHVAGAGALLKAAMPNWTPDMIRSALSLTATTNVKKEDGETQADFLDMGAGRIQVDQAVQAGLLLNETFDNYTNADPALGGEPRTLNIPSIYDNECAGICTWERTFTATQDGDWTVETQAISDGIQLSVTPESFSIQEGQTQTISVEINALAARQNTFIYASVSLASANSPDLNVPVIVNSSVGNLPSNIQTSATRSVDDVTISDVEMPTLSDFFATGFGITKATIVTDTVEQDSDTSDYLDDIQDGVVVTTIDVADDAKRAIFKLSSETAPDLDLFIVQDKNNDNALSGSEEIGKSISPNATEEVIIEFPEAGRYFIVVQSFTSSTSGSDVFELEYAVINETDDQVLTVNAPSSTTQNEPFDIQAIYDLGEFESGARYYSAIGISTNESEPDRLGLIELQIDAVQADTQIVGDGARLEANETATLTLQVGGNRTDEPREYRVIIAKPSDADFVSFSTASGGALENGDLVYTVTKGVSDTATSEFEFDIQISNEAQPGPILLTLTSELLNRNFDSTLVPESFDKVQVEGAPSITIDPNGGARFTVVETRQVEIPFTTIDPNNDVVSVTFTQTGGTQASVTVDDEFAIVTAPSVAANETLVFTVTATDEFDNSTETTLEIDVTNNRAPEITSVTAPASGTQGARVQVSFSATDGDNDELTYTINGVVGSSRSIILPSTGTSTTVTFSVTDGIDTATQTATINLLPRAEPPQRSGGGGGSITLWTLLLASILGLIRYRQVPHR